MAQASLLHPEQRFNHPSLCGRSLQQAHLQHPSNPRETTAPAQLFNYAHHPQLMAQPYPQHINPESYMRNQPWSAADQSYASADFGRIPNNTAFQQQSAWADPTMFDPDFNLVGNLDVTPQTVPHPFNSSALYFNHGLTYSGSATLGLDNKRSAQYNEESSWYPSHSTEVPCGVSVNGSDPETDCSYSPKSYVSETQGSDVLPFMPEPKADAGSKNTNSYYSTHAYAPIKTSSPVDSSTVKSDDLSVAVPGLARLGLNGVVPSPTHTVAGYSLNGLPLIYEDICSLNSSEYAYSQKSSPGLSPWNTEGGSANMTVMPFRPRVPPTSGAPINNLPSGYQAHHGSSEPRALSTWSGSRTSFPARDSFRERGPAHRVVDSHAERKADDQILLEGKREGLTYKEIRKKMYTKCAESTLRGRYRSLTKARQDRVRKPVWQKKDVELLRMFVQQDLDRINSNYLHHTLSCDQRLAKVQWKKVADSIHTSGGSYHFGNSTCKRKWQELNPGP